MTEVVQNKAEYQKLIPSLQRLFSAAFGKEISVEYLKWRYVDTPYEDILVVVEKDEQGQVVANYSASIQHLAYKHENWKAALSMTTMTHPAHQGKGLFTHLASTLYESMLDKQYNCIYGFPNRQSHYGFINKLGWVDVYEQGYIGLETKKSKVKPNNTELIFDNLFEFDYNHLIKRSKDFISVAKSIEYLKWRYSKNPIQKYQNIVLIDSSNSVLGYCVFKIFNNAAIDILEMNTNDISNTKQLLELVISYAHQNDISYISTWISVHSQHFSIYEKLGLGHMSTKMASNMNIQSVNTFFGLKLLTDNSACQKILPDYKNWNLEMSISDVY